jgi:EmrB/QacA subfamily drug resistance transporter
VPWGDSRGVFRVSRWTHAAASEELLVAPIGDGKLGQDAALEAGEAALASGEPSPRRHIVFFVCAIALFMASVDSTIVATALGHIGQGLHARINWLGWTITIYSLGQIIIMPVAGRISDQFGRKRIFIVCAVIFTVSSVACGLSTSIEMLIPLRLIQSLGGGGFLPSASGIVSDHFGRDRDRALGLFSSIFPIGGVAGPIFGGLITQYWDWRGVFFVNLPIGLVLIVLIVKVIPHTARKSPERLDFPAIGLLATMIIGGMIAITTLGEAGTSLISPGVLLPFLTAIVLGVLFFRHLKRTATPLIPMEIITGKGFGIMNLINVCFGAAGFGFGVLVPLYAENRYHIGTASAGTILSAQAIGMTTVATIASWSLRRTGYRKPMVLGFVVISCALIGLSIAPRGLSPYFWLALFSMISGLGLGAAAPASNNATLALAPEHVAAISGLRATFRQTGSIISVETVTALIARSAHPGLAQAHLFWVLAVILALITSLTVFVPNRRASW